MEPEKGNSVKKDILLVVGSVFFFYLMLVIAGWIDGKFGLAQAYTLVDVASLALKVSTASALAWVVKRVVFTHTLGRDFGTVFNQGWNSLDIKEKSRWIIGTFLVIFFAVMQASGK